jgi:hypothetical protein
MLLNSSSKMFMIKQHIMPHIAPVITDSFTYSLASLTLFAPIILPTKTEKAIAKAIGITWNI